jgi:16S rRNA processing protein RimM
MDHKDSLDFVVIGEITKPHGVRGELRVLTHTDYPDRFTWLEKIYVGADDPQPYVVEGVRRHKGMILLKLAGFDYRDQAESLRGQLLLIPETEVVALEEGEYYHFQLEGLQMETVAGEPLGIVTQVMETGANLIFVVQGGAREILIPHTDEVVQEIDLDNGRIIIQPLPGLLPE